MIRPSWQYKYEDSNIGTDQRDSGELTWKVFRVAMTLPWLPNTRESKHTENEDIIPPFAYTQREIQWEEIDSKAEFSGRAFLFL